MDTSINLALNYPLEESVEFIKRYSWLAEFRIFDFLVSDYWNTCKDLPESWKAFANNLDNHIYQNELLKISSLDPLDGDHVHQDLVEFIRTCERLSLSQDAAPKYTSPPAKRRNIKQKKTYEIENLAYSINKIMVDTEITEAVDIGSGQGYLALELLQMNHQINILAVECAEIQAHGALRRLEELQSKDLSDRFCQKQMFLKADEEYFSTSSPKINRLSPHLMYSLHACGSLSECMIQMFCRENSSAKALYSIGCCYNLIDETLPGLHFPMSFSLSQLWDFPLTRNMKMLACQSPHRWIHRPRQTENFWKRHFYRALLELLLHKELAVSFPSVGNISDAALRSFPEYVRAACCNLDLSPPCPSLILQVYDSYQHLEKRMAFMWTMRALLGPVIESVILLDRYTYIREHCAPALVTLQPVLDPLYSPRNMAIIAIKDT